MWNVGVSLSWNRRFLDEYENRPVKWGFGDMSWVTYKRTYSRDGEDWWQTCQRVIEGMFTVQRVHCMVARPAVG